MRRRSNPSGRWSQSVSAWGSPRERREADLFLADLLGRLPRRQARRPAPVAEFDPHPAQEFDPSSELDQEAWDEVVQACGFFGHGVWRTEQAVRNAIVARARAEWAAWHNGAVPVAESDATRFGRLVGYYLAENEDIEPAHLMALQTAALGTINYAPLLGASNTVAGVRAALITAAAVPNTPTMQTRVTTGLTRAREANKNKDTAFSSWSAVFIVGCVRGAAITLRLEAVKHQLLLATFRHSEYTREARIRKDKGQLGTYHAFTPAERAPQIGDIIVQDRQPNIGPNDVRTLANLPERHLTHGDIVVDVQPTFVETIGGNLTRPDPPPATPSAPTPPPIGESSRKRRYPKNAQGFLVIDPSQLFVQEDDNGNLAPLPLASTEALHKHTTQRIFAVLSLVEECRAPRTLPYSAGSLA